MAKKARIRSPHQRVEFDQLAGEAGRAAQYHHISRGIGQRRCLRQTHAEIAQDRLGCTTCRPDLQRTVSAPEHLADPDDLTRAEEDPELVAGRDLAPWEEVERPRIGENLRDPRVSGHQNPLDILDRTATGHEAGLFETASVEPKMHRASDRLERGSEAHSKISAQWRCWPARRRVLQDQMITR
ncbi:MAG: hypothetical protein AAFR17_05235 [Pseudomonadota bacterium]